MQDDVQPDENGNYWPRFREKVNEIVQKKGMQPAFGGVAPPRRKQMVCDKCHRPGHLMECGSCRMRLCAYCQRETMCLANADTRTHTAGRDMDEVVARMRDSEGLTDEDRETLHRKMAETI